MKKLQRNPEKFDVLDLFSTMSINYNYNLSNNISVNDFINRIQTSIKQSQDNDMLKHGKRIESLFAYIVGALGEVKLLTQEDSGNIYYVGDEILAPDYRLTLNNGEQIFVEVKNFYTTDLTKEYRLTKEYFNKLKIYSELNNIKLKFAIYFTTMNKWVLLPIEAFNETSNSYDIDFVTAFAKSEMSLLGDRMIGTTPNLEIHILTNEYEAQKIDTSGITGFTIRETKFFCANQEIKDIIEQNILYNLVMYGTWIEKSTEAIMNENKLLGIKFIYSPSELTEQNFEMIGLLSSMISNKFKELTIKNGKVEALDLGINPSEFKIFIPNDYDSQLLPLWQFIINSNEDFKGIKK